MSQLDSWGGMWDLAEDTAGTANNSAPSSCQTAISGSVKGTDSQNLTNHSSSNRLVISLTGIT